MFTGIIESLGEVVAIEHEGENVHFTLTCPFMQELRVDQSVAHDGVCLTVVRTSPSGYTVTAIAETLRRTHLGDWKKGSKVNLERSMQLGGRVDGHLVQGHVDAVGNCTGIQEENGSWLFSFRHDPAAGITVEKGSITVNGVSLTVVASGAGHFSVAIIPYTYAHTTFHTLSAGDSVNLEFDVIGKYVARYLAQTGAIPTPAH